MKKLLSNDYLTLLCRLIFGGIFIYASLDKIGHPAQFARIVFNYHLVPGMFVNIFALILPLTEFIAGLFLIVGLLYRGSRNLLLTLSAVFVVAILVNVIRGVNLECGCFTVSSGAKKAGIMLILRDFLFFIPGVMLLFSSSYRWTVDRLFFLTSPNR
jgi:uncharacterized membrane protein YphA (DoxX/SURF4 family)